MARKQGIYKTARKQAIYVACLVKGGQLVAPVKIGVSVAPNGRVTDLSAQMPFEIRLVRIFMPTCQHSAPALERLLHAELATYRLRGEWFDLAPDECLELVAAFLGDRVKPADRGRPRLAGRGLNLLKLNSACSTP